ncbi:putative serine/threonine protein kinase, putative,protein kinase [Trypanosoma grayi]|uniref:putative serine/threonine protein kinase, putative,protein kinase n=1 Tax=Trypanosoma grayi TaxID=71804 RepID=UPI0004F40300|nr:putative serine/threonine protein kinase, putative,protein kinase [Trypanosoma grayi]KEG11091.1 putative serine/threonine protein kinase, putative,protein kinase [Trypanosoma grayi]
MPEMRAGNGAQGHLLSRQKRPATVARFLNSIPLNDRHAATNALLILGMRAYGGAVAAAPADLHTLRAVVAMELAEDGTGTGAEAGKNNNDPVRRRNTQLHQPINGNDGDDESEKTALPSLQQQRQKSSATTVTPAAAEKRSTVGVSKTMSDGGHATVSQKTEDPSSEKMVTVTDKKTRPVVASPLVASASDCSSRVCSSRQQRNHTPALSFILGNALSGVMAQRSASRRTGLNITSTLGHNGVHPGDDQSTNHDLSVYDVSDGTVDEQGSAIDAAIGVSINGTMLPLESDDHYYPMEFLQCIKRHIEVTRGVRENTVLVAASIPQHMAMYTLYSSFDGLYRSLLVSYHLSYANGKGSPHS